MMTVAARRTRLRIRSRHQWSAPSTARKSVPKMPLQQHTTGLARMLRVADAIGIGELLIVARAHQHGFVYPQLSQLRRPLLRRRLPCSFQYRSHSAVAALCSSHNA